jgi:hypothetical protein
MWKSLRTTEEAEKDATITEEVVAVNAEAQADLEEEVLQEEASDQEKKVDSEAIEIQLQERNVQTDPEEKADLIAIALLKKENQVLFKEKIEHQDVLKDQMINQQVVHLRLLKAEGRGSSSQFQFVYPEKEIIITPFFTNVMTEFFFEILSFDF